MSTTLFPKKGHFVRGGGRIVGSAFNITNAVVASGSSVIDDVAMAALRSMGIGTSSAVVQTALRGVTAGFGVIFTVIDIVTLVKDYNDHHPLLKELERIKGLYMNDMDFCNTLLELLSDV